MTRRYDPSRARRHWVYSRLEVLKLFGVSEGTIANWIRRGLTSIDSCKPQLFAGFELRRFLTEQRWRHGRSPENGRLFCYFCFQFQPLKAASLNLESLDSIRIRIAGHCTHCDSMLHVNAAHGNASLICQAATKTTGDSSAVSVDGVSGRGAENGPILVPEKCKSNQRLLYRYRIYLGEAEGFASDTIDEHLRSLAWISSFMGHRPFGAYKIDDVVEVKNRLRDRRSTGDLPGMSASTVQHTLLRAGAFFAWLDREAEVRIVPGLYRYFNLSRRESRIANDAVKATELTFDQALCIFKSALHREPIEIRNRAIIAMFIVTGIRVSALATLRGKHVNMETRWINQDEREVDTKDDKHIRTYCLDLGHGLLDAIREWERWRRDKGFGDNDAFFLPDRYIQSNAIDLGYISPAAGRAECWKSADGVQAIVKQAAEAAGLDPSTIAAHDFRKVLVTHLTRHGEMNPFQEVAQQLNLGHRPQETTRKHYIHMTELERMHALDELCLRARDGRSDLQLYRAFEDGKIPENDPVYARAKLLFELHSGSDSP